MNLYKFKSLENIEFALDIILHEQLYCADYDKLNDPFEGLFFTIIRSGGFSSAFGNGFDHQVKECKAILAQLKICSLSNSLNDVRMWSFYADDHKGIAIEINFDGFENDINKVDYLENLPEYNLTNPDHYEILTKKTRHWFYESEYRIIRKEEYYPVNGRIKAIYLGQRISNIHLEILKKNIPYKTPIYQTKLDIDEIKIQPDNLLVR